MNKLKTLKDFQHEGNLVPRHIIEESGETGFINAVKFIENRKLKELKQEAIKDIKNFDNPRFHFPKICGYTKKERNAIINYIKWKNNLTEDDLA